MAEKTTSDKNRLNWSNYDDCVDWSKGVEGMRYGDSLSPGRRCNGSRQQCVIQLILRTTQKYMKYMVTGFVFYIY